MNDIAIDMRQIDRVVELCLRFGTTSNRCWKWPFSLDKSGYARCWDPAKKKKVMVHRAAYELVRGGIPIGFEADHLCRERSCFNPNHLEAVPKKVNTERRIHKNTKKTHCDRGHPFSGDNLYLRPDNGKRQCKRCQRQQVETHRLNRKKATR